MDKNATKDNHLYNATTSMANLNVNNNNSNSDGEQFPQESTGTNDLVIHYDHRKAQEIYKEFSQCKKMTDEIIKEMRESFVLHDCARKIGREIANDSRLNLEDLQENIIAASEAIHYGLQDETIRNRFTGYYDLPKDPNTHDDRLFGIALHNLYYSLHEYQDEIIGNINEIYGVE